MGIVIGSFVASGKICKVLLLGVGTMAVAIRGRDVARGEAGPGSNPLSNPYAFTTIDVPGVFDTEPHGINGAGQIVGTFKDTGGHSHGFLRDAGGAFTPIDIPGATSTTAYGINTAGQIVGTSKDTGGDSHGVLRDAGETYSAITGHGGNGAPSIMGFGIKRTGQIVGASGDNTGEVVGLLRDAGGTFTIITGSPGYANGINGASQIVGDGQDPNTGTIHGYLAVPSGLIQQAANSGTNIPSLNVTMS